MICALKYISKIKFSIPVTVTMLVGKKYKLFVIRTLEEKLCYFKY